MADIPYGRDYPDAPWIDRDSQPIDDLAQSLSTFRRWLHMDDEAPVFAVAGVVVANLAEGDPVWLLVVGPPSGGKTEILQSVSELDYVVLAATITEASLLSGTSAKERAKDATGGLLRQVGKFGILLAKDFTSVLSQNHDTARAAMAAMREVYDGRWHRPVGTDGGRVLKWDGKCGFLGGVTPSYDRYSAIVNALGDRYLLLRLPNVDPDKQARAALAQAEHEKQMRAELAQAMTTLIAGADLTLVHAELDDGAITRLVRLASFAARARTAVERDGYSKELLVLPQPEGPARLVKALRRVYGGLAAIGVDDETCWQMLSRIAVDCAPAVRVPLMRALLNQNEPTRTTVIAAKVGMTTKTARAVLDDLALLGVAERRKLTDANNSPDLWAASDWLHQHWPNPPEKVGTKSTTQWGEGEKDDRGTCPPPRTFRAHFAETVESGHEKYDPVETSGEPALFEAPSTYGHQCDCGNQLVTAEALAAGKCKPCRHRERVR